MKEWKQKERNEIWRRERRLIEKINGRDEETDKWKEKRENEENCKRGERNKGK